MSHNNNNLNQTTHRETSLKLILFLAFVSLIFPLMFISGLSVENTLELWIDKKSEDYQSYQNFVTHHGSDEWAMVVVIPDDTSNKIDFLSDTLQSNFDAISNAEEVVPLNDSPLLWSDYTQSQPFLNELSAWSLEKQTMNRNGLGWKIKIKPGLDAQSRLEVYDEIIDSIESISPNSEYHLGGPAIFSATLDKVSSQEGKVLFPVAFAVVVIISLIKYRSFQTTFYLLSCIGSALIWTLGVVVATGNNLNLITLALPALVSTIALAGASHVTHLTSSAKNSTWSERYFASLRLLALPLTIASLTTAFGFLALTGSHLDPIQQMGWMSSVGIIFSWVYNLFVLPALLTRNPIINNDGITTDLNHENSFLFQFISRSVQYFSLELLTFISVTTISLGFLIPGLVAKTDVLEFFSKEHRIIQDYHWLESNWSALTPIEWDLTGNREEVDYWIAQLNHDFSTDDRVQSLIFSQAPDSSQTYRVSLLSNWMDNESFNELTEDLEQWNRSILRNTTLQSHLTGSIALINRSQIEIIRTQIQSIITALILISITLLLALRSLRLFIIGLLVNLAPIILLFGLMSMLLIPLNTATVMVSSIVLGIAVDDTVFFLARYLTLKKSMERSGETSLSYLVNHAYQDVFSPVSFTTCVAMAGFLVLCFSDFRPMSFFGGLGAIGMFLAWVADIILLPILLKFPEDLKTNPVSIQYNNK